MSAEWRDRLDAARRAPAIDYALARGVKDEALRAAFARFRRRRVERRLAARCRAAGVGRRRSVVARRLRALPRAARARARAAVDRSGPKPLRAATPTALAAARARAGRTRFSTGSGCSGSPTSSGARPRSSRSPVSLLGDLPFMVDGDSADVWAHADVVPPRRVGRRAARRLQRDRPELGPARLPVGRHGGARLRVAARPRAAQRRALRRLPRRSPRRLLPDVRASRATARPPFFTPADEADQLALGETVLSIFADAGARIVAEDLGTIPDFVRESLARLEIPGYKVLRWERDWEEEGQPFRAPADYPPVSVATSGTHDTETMAAWWDGLEPDERRQVIEAPGVVERLNAHGADKDAAAGKFTPAIRDALLAVLYRSPDRISCCCRSRTCSAGATASTCRRASASTTGRGSCPGPSTGSESNAPLRRAPGHCARGRTSRTGGDTDEASSVER